MLALSLFSLVLPRRSGGVSPQSVPSEAVFVSPQGYPTANSQLVRVLSSPNDMPPCRAGRGPKVWGLARRNLYTPNKFAEALSMRTVGCAAWIGQAHSRWVRKAGPR